MQKWCLVNTMRLQLGELLRADSEMPTAEQGTGMLGPPCRLPQPALPSAQPQQGHGHVPSCSVPLPRVLHPSAFHTLLRTRVPLMALIILQTPALCFALGRWHVAEAGRAGSAAPAACRGRQSLQHQLPQEISRVGAAPAQPFSRSHPTATRSLGWSRDVSAARKRRGGGSAGAPAKGGDELLQPLFL